MCNTIKSSLILYLFLYISLELPERIDVIQDSMGDFHESVEDKLSQILTEVSISRARINDQMLAVENSIMSEIGRRNVDICQWIDNSKSHSANKFPARKSKSYTGSEIPEVSSATPLDVVGNESTEDLRNIEPGILRHAERLL